MPQRIEGENVQSLTIIQEFDTGRMLESMGARLDFPLVLSETIDNALDHAKGGFPVKFSTQFYPQDKRIIFKDENTTGMSIEDLQNYIRFGTLGRPRERGSRGIHGMGGKVSHLFLLGNNGSLHLRTNPDESNTTYNVDFVEWKKNLQQGKSWEIRQTQRERGEKRGTILLLEGVAKNISKSSELVELARELGYRYGPCITKGEVEINLSLIHGRRVENIKVQPEVVHFSESGKKQATKRSGLSGQGPEIEVTWGLIDTEKREQLMRDMNEAYKNKVNKPKIGGDAVHVYSQGKFVQSLGMGSMGYEGYRPRLGFANWACVVNIVKGDVGMDLYKEMLDRRDPATQDIIQTVRTLTQKDVRNIAQESDRKRAITTTQLNKATMANEAFKSAFRTLYSSKEKFAQEFGLQLNIQREYFRNKTNQTEQAVEQAGGVFIPPGTREPYKARQGGREKSGRREDVNVYAEIALGFFGKDDAWSKIIETPDAAVVMLNLEHPAIESVLRGNQKDAAVGLLNYAAQALVQRKYGGRAPEEKLQEESSYIVKEALEYLD